MRPIIITNVCLSLNFGSGFPENRVSNTREGPESRNLLLEDLGNIFCSGKNGGSVPYGRSKASLDPKINHESPVLATLHKATFDKWDDSYPKRFIS